MGLEGNGQGDWLIRLSRNILPSVATTHDRLIENDRRECPEIQANSRTVGYSPRHLDVP